MQRMIDERYARMPWDEVDTVVFDVGDVLLHYAPEAELETFFPGEEEKQRRLLKKIIKTPYWIMLDRGTITMDEAIAAMTGRDEDLAGAIRLVMENFFSFVTVVEEGVRALEACHARGKRTLVLSNYRDKAFTRVEKEYPFFDLFEAKIVSARVHMLKPNPEIYAYAVKTYRLDPARTLFIDDTPANVEGAMHMGWQGLCFNEAGKLDRFMRA